jgi:hypothetical protein
MGRELANLGKCRKARADRPYRAKSARTCCGVSGYSGLCGDVWGVFFMKTIWPKFEAMIRGACARPSPFLNAPPYRLTTRPTLAKSLRPRLQSEQVGRP